MFCSLESDLFPDDVSVLPLHLGARFRLGLDAQKLILVPQVHLMFYCGCGSKATRGDTLGLAESTHGLTGYAGVATELYTFSHGLLLLDRILLLAKVFLIQGLLLKDPEQGCKLSINR